MCFSFTLKYLHKCGKVGAGRPLVTKEAQCIYLLLKNTKIKLHGLHSSE